MTSLVRYPSNLELQAWGLYVLGWCANATSGPMKRAERKFVKQAIDAALKVKKYHRDQVRALNNAQFFMGGATVIMNEWAEEDKADA